jgi:multicomponent Na+:H+ antiporter subunit A
MGVMMGILLGLVVVSLLCLPVFRRFGPNAFPATAVVLGAAFVLLAVQTPSVLDGNVQVERIQWVPLLDLSITLRLDPVSLIFALLVTGAGALILLYCWRYFERSEEGLARFAAVFVAFAASMLGLVLADDVYLLFLFWEATTVFSFLLIGHASYSRTSRAAALQALMVTTLGGLAMLVGLVILAHAAGTSQLSAILANPPGGTAVHVAVFLVLIGALSKSAIFPFHFWLPGAMAAPTPVSAYLHAAAMVKAGIYLIARMGPAFGEVAGYRETLVILGGITMINGGIRALRQFDIKLIVAHSTVSQLGFLVMMFGIADPRTDLAAFALVFAHAVAKAPLFLAVGIIDHRTGTRDLRKLSGLWRQAPVLAAITFVAAASMAGFPPLAGFVAKESAFAELLVVGQNDPLAILAFAVAAAGSVLTVAYMGRFLWGAFATKRGVEPCVQTHRQYWSTLVAPAAFAVLAIAGGIGASSVNPWFEELVSTVYGQPIPEGMAPESLALWHGFTPALGASALVLAVGVMLALWLCRPTHLVPAVSDRFSGAHAYWLITHWLDVCSVRLTAFTQRGSLPFYLSVILIVAVFALGGTLVTSFDWPQKIVWATSSVQLPIAIVMIVATLASLRAPTRFQAVVLVGVTGYGMAALFALHGAPDIALTQALVETVTLIAFVLVIRRLPQRITMQSTRRVQLGRAVIGLGVGLTLGAAAVVALGSRIAEPISLQLPALAVSGGHGTNVVNVMLVDIRGWDTFGELSVIVAAATGIASLVFLRTRGDNLPKLSRQDARSRINKHLLRVADPNDSTERGTWLLAGRHLSPERRSIMLEVVVRVIFHALILLSLYLLLTGHNSPGGGFAGGLVAGLALVARYLAGGRYELGATVSLDAGRILGVGFGLATTVAIIPLFFGQSALASAWVDLDLGPFGNISVVTSTFFDIGVYLVIFGLILDVLRSLGAKVDEQEEEDEAIDTSLEEASRR